MSAVDHRGIEYVSVDTGNGELRIEDPLDLWAAIWRAVAYAIQFRQLGDRCACGCEVESCVYCAHDMECATPAG